MVDVKDRPDILEGFTSKMVTGMGNLYVTVTEFDGKPFEVFAIIRKSCKSTTAKTEAIGLLVSLALRSGIKGSAKNNFPFSHPIFRPSLSDPSRPWRDKILEIVPLLAGWFCNFGSNKSDLNLDAKNDNLFFAEP